MEQTIPVIIRMKPSVKKKWKTACAKTEMSYAEWIEKMLINKA